MTAHQCRVCYERQYAKRGVACTRYPRVGRQRPPGGIGAISLWLTSVRHSRVVRRRRCLRGRNTCARCAREMQRLRTASTRASCRKEGIPRARSYPGVFAHRAAPRVLHVRRIVRGNDGTHAFPDDDAAADHDGAVWLIAAPDRLVAQRKRACRKRRPFACRQRDIGRRGRSHGSADQKPCNGESAAPDRHGAEACEARRTRAG
jgi:hypothetical protein